MKINWLTKNKRFLIGGCPESQHDITLLREKNRTHSLFYTK